MEEHSYLLLPNGLIDFCYRARYIKFNEMGPEVG
jgi:hypothetical protein